MKFSAALTAISTIFAIAAALLWLASARVKTPTHFSISVVRSNGAMGQPFGGNPLGASFVGQAHSQDLLDLATALRLQSKLSALAAACAAVSAFAQVWAIFI